MFQIVNWLQNQGWGFLPGRLWVQSEAQGFLLLRRIESNDIVDGSFFLPPNLKPSGTLLSLIFFIYFCPSLCFLSLNYIWYESQNIILNTSTANCLRESVASNLFYSFCWNFCIWLFFHFQEELLSHLLKFCLNKLFNVIILNSSWTESVVLIPLVFS